MCRLSVLSHVAHIEVYSSSFRFKVVEDAICRGDMHAWH